MEELEMDTLIRLARKPTKAPLSELNRSSIGSYVDDEYLNDFVQFVGDEPEQMASK
jgi:hypothetical protein